MERSFIDLTQSDLDNEIPEQMNAATGLSIIHGRHRTVTQQNAARRPRNLVEDAIVGYRIQGDKRRVRKASALSREPPTAAHIELMMAASSIGPNYLGRTSAARAGGGHGPAGRKSNGMTTEDEIKPAASINDDHACHARLIDLTQGEITFMVGSHLSWADKRGDELSSYSKSFTFLVMHALSRHTAGAQDVTVQFFDRRRTSQADGSPAVFYPAPSLFEIFEVARKYPSNSEKIKSTAMFTQEFLAHGNIILNQIRLRPASIEDLIEKGLLEILPLRKDEHGEFVVARAAECRNRGFPNGRQRSFLKSQYDSCTETVPISLEVFARARDLALCFVKVPAGVTMEPPLAIFLHFLCFYKRESGQATFVRWMRQRYSAIDVLGILQNEQGVRNPTFTWVEANLPECFQYIDLVRDCCAVFNLPALPANKILPVLTKKRSISSRPADTAHQTRAKGRVRSSESSSRRGSTPAPSRRRTTVSMAEDYVDVMDLDGPTASSITSDGKRPEGSSNDDSTLIYDDEVREVAFDSSYSDCSRDSDLWTARHERCWGWAAESNDNFGDTERRIIQKGKPRVMLEWLEADYLPDDYI